ncbi:ABC transporter substrate-binding protein, partial [Bacillus cereus]|nr:ABC transporter substrate-binding protein [Bacillus cereus]
MKKIFCIAAATALSLSACSGADNATPGSDSSDPGEKGYDVSKIQKDDKVAALVPQEISKR